MTENPQNPLYQLLPDEKVTQVMVYTANSMGWGEVVTKTQIRLSTWLRTAAAPDSISMFNAHILLPTPGVAPKPLSFNTLNISLPNVLAFHILPPNKDSLDYDLGEPNRKMEPVTILIGIFRVNALMRMSTKSTLNKHLEINRETFCMLYEAEVNCPILPSFPSIKVSQIIVRQAYAIFCNRI